MVPRSRLDAVELELDDAEIRLRKIQRNATDEIERLTAEISALRESCSVIIVAWPESGAANVARNVLDLDFVSGSPEPKYKQLARKLHKQIDKLGVTADSKHKSTS